MSKIFQDRIALVTGASRGIGRALAVELAREGAHVIALARTQGGLESLDDEIRAFGGQTTLAPCDVRDGEALDRLGLAIHQRWGKLDVFIGNAAVLGPVTPLPHVDPPQFDEAMAINVTANWRLLRSLDSLLRASDAGFEIDTDRGTVQASQLVVATGGLSIPKIGATDFGYRLARQFGHKIIETRPALVPLTFEAQSWQPFVALAGLSLQSTVRTGSGKTRGEFAEDLLFTHRGLSGPAVLQISSYWRPGTPVEVDLAPEHDLQAALSTAKHASKRKLSNELADLLPRRLADAWLATQPEVLDQPLPQCRDRDLTALANSLKRWSLVPSGTEGYRKAEVTAGGVDTRDISSATLESKRVAGLHFIGEVVDVTGWLGGYNFQWAWASAAACAKSVAKPVDAG